MSDSSDSSGAIALILERFRANRSSLAIFFRGGESDLLPYCLQGFVLIYTNVAFAHILINVAFAHTRISVAFVHTPINAAFAQTPLNVGLCTPL